MKQSTDNSIYEASMAHPEHTRCYEGRGQEDPVLRVGMWSSGHVPLILQNKDQVPKKY